MDTKKSAVKEALKEEKQTGISRRAFLKRSAYTAPVLMAMGQLTKPTGVHADGSNPAGCPDDGFIPCN